MAGETVNESPSLISDTDIDSIDVVDESANRTLIGGRRKSSNDRTNANPVPGGAIKTFPIQHHIRSCAEQRPASIYLFTLIHAITYKNIPT